VRDPGGAAPGAAEVSVDGRMLDGPVIPLIDDGARHEVVVRAGRGATAGATAELNDRGT
jgi:hypothetical protein